MPRSMERDLYEPLRRYWQRQGYIVEGAANARSFVLPLSLQTVDLIAFKRKRDDIDTIGIEVKRGDERPAIRAAIAQAAAYQVVIPRVFIATSALQGFSDIKQHLREMGVGYIKVKKRVYGAPVLRPGPCTFREAAYKSTIRNAGLLSILAHETPDLRDLGDGPWRSHASVWSRSGTPRPGGAASWGFGTHSQQAVQVMLDLPADDKYAYATVWAERRRTLLRIFDRRNWEHIVDLVRAAKPDRIEVRHWDRTGHRAKPKPAIYSEKASGQGLHEARRWAIRRLEPQRHVTPLALRFRLWPRREAPTYPEADRKLSIVLRRVLALRTGIAVRIREEEV